MPSSPQNPSSRPPSPDCLKQNEVELITRGQVSPERRQVLAAHVPGCAYCQAIVAAARRSQGAAASRPSNAATPSQRAPLRPSNHGQSGPANPQVTAPSRPSSPSAPSQRVTLRPRTQPQPQPGAPDADAPTQGAPGPAPGMPAQDSGEITPGTRIGRYVTDRVLGQGGMGAVYLAHDPELDRRVAIKLLHPTLSVNPENRARLLREAQAMARVSHPHVVAVHDVVTWQDQVFVAMEYVEGTTLKDWMRTRRSLHQILEVFRMAGEGLAAAHAAGLIHRDFKPGNVLMGVDGSVQVSDFGLARSLDAASEPAPTDAEEPSTRSSALLEQELTQRGLLMGTLGYMSPEQMMLRPIDARSDQFSFCVTLYEALYGPRPFKGRDATAMVRAIYERVFEPPTSRVRVPPWIHEVILRGLSPEPADRFPSMAALLTALRRDPEAEESSKARIRQRMRRGAMLGTLATVLVLAIASTQAWRSFEERAQGLLLISRPRPWNPDVFILAVDQPSIRQLGWPIGRLVQARMLEALERAGVAAVGIDAFLISPAKEGPHADEYFGKVMARYGKVALAAPCTTDDGIDLDTLAKQVEASSLPAGPSPRFDCGRIVVPLDPFLRSALVAQVEVARSASGNVRGAYLLADVAGRTLPGLGLSTYLLGQGMKPGSGLFQEEGAVRVGPTRIPLTDEGAVLTSFRLPDGDHFLSYGALHAALGDTNPPDLPPEVVEMLKGKYVIMGQTAESIRDLGPFANGMQLPLVLLHAALLSDLLEKDPVREVPAWVEFALIVLCGALLTVAALVLRPTLTFAAVLVVLVGILGGTLLLAKNGLVLGPLGPMMASVLALALVLAGRLSAEERARSRVRVAFDGYVDEAELDKLLADADRPELLNGAQKHISVLHAHIQDPTGELERLPPEERIERLRRAFQVMTEEVVRRKGRVEALRGDGLLAVFGDPLALSDHAPRAVETAQAIHARLAELARTAEQGRGLEARVGVSTGDAIIGNVGLQGGKMEYAVTGTPLERALELARLAPAGGVFVAESTHDACGSRFSFGRAPESSGAEPVFSLQAPPSAGAGHAA